MLRLGWHVSSLLCHDLDRTRALYVELQLGNAIWQAARRGGPEQGLLQCRHAGKNATTMSRSTEDLRLESRVFVSKLEFCRCSFLASTLLWALHT